jgi:hypothetical protein
MSSVGRVFGCSVVRLAGRSVVRPVDRGGRRARSLRGLTPLAGALLLALSACGYSDAITNAYATRAEAEQAGAVERGWVPRGLPASTTDLREAHSDEGGRVWGLFSFAPEDAGAVRALLQPESITAQGLRPEIPARIEWWPVLLRGTLDGEKLKSAGLAAHRSTDGRFVMIVNWKQGRAYYWTN